MSPNCDEYPWDGCRKHIQTRKRKEEIKSSDTSLLGFSENCSVLSTISDIHIGTAHKINGSAHKRRKLYGNSVALLSEEDTNITKLSAYNYKLSYDDNHLAEIKDNLGLAPTVYIDDRSKYHLDNVSVKTSNCDLEKSAKDTANLNGWYSSSKGNLECSSASKNMRTKRKVSGKSSAHKEPLEQFSSADEDTLVKELVISVFERDGQLWNPIKNRHRLPCSPSQPCELCGCLEDPLKMLICDHCEKAFHLSCCNPEVKKLEVDDWYCEPCKAIISTVLKERHLRENRIGGDFQVDVPQWSGANFIDQVDDEPLEMDPTNFTGPNELNFKKANSLGNWIQCQGEIGKDENGQMIICGKWRRAPLFVEQHEEWDCSCAIFWDPLHADCVVPQELPTSEVKKQLSFMNKVNVLLAEGQLEEAEETWHLGDHQGND